MNYIKIQTKLLLLSMVILFSCQDYEFDISETRFPNIVENFQIKGALMDPINAKKLTNLQYEFSLNYEVGISEGVYYFKIEGGESVITKNGRAYNPETTYVPISAKTGDNFFMKTENFLIEFPNSGYIDYKIKLYYHQTQHAMTEEWLVPITSNYADFTANVTNASFTVQPIALQSQSSKLLGTQNLIFTRIISTKDKLKDISFEVTKSGESIEYNGLVQYDINADNTISMNQLKSSAGIAFKAINTETFNNSAFRNSNTSENNAALSPSEIYIDRLFSDNGKTDTKIDSLVQDSAREDVFYVADIAITYSAIKTGQSTVTLAATSLGVESTFEDVVTVIDAQFAANYTFETTFLPNIINPVNYVVSSLNTELEDNTFEMYFTSDDPNLRLHRTISNEETIYNVNDAFSFDSSYWNGNIGIKTTSTGTYTLTFHLKETVSGTIVDSQEYTINSNSAMFAMETPNFPTSTFVNNENTFAYSINDITENLANSLLINNETTGFAMSFISDDDSFRLIDGADTEYASNSVFEIASDSDNFGLAGKLASGNIKFKSSNTGTSTVTFTLTENESRTTYAITKEFIINNTTLNEDTISISLFSNDVPVGVTSINSYENNTITINDANTLNTYDVKIERTARSGNINNWNFYGLNYNSDSENINYEVYPAHNTLNDISTAEHLFYFLSSRDTSSFYTIIGIYDITISLLRDDGAELAITKTLEIIDDRINFSLVGTEDRTVDITTASNSLNQFSESSFFDFNYIAPTSIGGLTVSYECFTNEVESTALGVFVNNTEFVLGTSYPASLTTPVIVAKEVGDHILRVHLTLENGGTLYLDVPITVNSVNLARLITYTRLRSIDATGTEREDDQELHTREDPRFRLALNVSPTTISSKIVNSLSPRLLFDKYETRNTTTDQSSLSANNIELIGSNSIRQGTHSLTNTNYSQDFVISDITTRGYLYYRFKLVLGGVVPTTTTNNIYYNVSNYQPGTLSINSYSSSASWIETIASSCTYEVPITIYNWTCYNELQYSITTRSPSNPDSGECTLSSTSIRRTTRTGYKKQRTRSATGVISDSSSATNDVDGYRGYLTFTGTETQTQTTLNTSNCTYTWDGVSSVYSSFIATGQYTDNWGYVYNSALNQN